MLLVWVIIIIDIYLYHMINVVLFSFPHHKFAPLFIPHFLRKIGMHSPHLRKGEVVFYLLEGGVSKFITWNYSAVSSSLFSLTYFSNNLLVYVWILISYFECVCVWYEWNYIFVVTSFSSLIIYDMFPCQLSRFSFLFYLLNFI